MVTESVCGLYYKHTMIVNYASSVVKKLEALLTDDARVVIYNRHNTGHWFYFLDAIDFVLLRETLQRLKEGKKVEVPIYNFVSHRRESKSVSMYGADVLIFEGILAFHMPDIVNMLDVKVSNLA